MFNDGYAFILTVMNDLILQIGIQCKAFVDTYDKHRIDRQNRRSQSKSKKAKTDRKEEAVTQMDGFAEEEGILYGPGIAD